LNDRMPTEHSVQVMPKDRTESRDESKTEGGQEAPESSASAPTLQLMTAGGESACTSDGCAVRFTKG